MERKTNNLKHKFKVEWNLSNYVIQSDPYN